tara:strand:+ start:7 stop:276 length:270 start_codon:yes stop_codon:yes gene_type:complete
MAKEKTVELKPKADKISKEHLEELQTIVNGITKIQYEIGKTEGMKHNQLHELGMLQKEVVRMQDVLKKEYGNFDVNISDGTINWKSDEK